MRERHDNPRTMTFELDIDEAAEALGVKPWVEGGYEIVGFDIVIENDRKYVRTVMER